MNQTNYQSMYKGVICLLFGILTTCSLLAQNGSYEIILKPAANTQYQEIFEVEQTIEQSLMGMEQTILQTILMGMDVEIQPASNGNSTEIQYRFNRYLQVADAPGFNLTIDTDDPEPEFSQPQFEAMHKSFLGMIGKNLSVVVSQEGQLEELRGLDEFIESVVNELGVEDEMTQAALKEQLGQTIGEKSMQQVIDNAYGFIPGKAIAVGDTWEKSVEMNQMVNMVITTTYTLDKVTQDTAFISGSSVVESGENGIEMETGFGLVQAKMDGKMESTILYDLKENNVIRTSTKQNLEGTAFVESEQLPGGSMEIPMKIESLMKLTHEPNP